MSDWKTEKMNQLLLDIEDSKDLALKLKAMSQQILTMAEEFDSGAISKPVSATNIASELRELIARRNKLVKSMKEAVNDLAPDLKRAGIL